jgi:hypothetical protein
VGARGGSFRDEFMRGSGLSLVRSIMCVGSASGAPAIDGV